jgi:hypothetical protein
MTEHTYDEAVAVLRERNVLSGWGKQFTVASLRALCHARNIPSLRDRLQAAGMLTLTQVAADLHVAPATVKSWQRAGLITGRRVDGRREYLYHPGQNRPTGNTRRDATLRRYQKMSDPSAMLSPARSSSPRPPETARGLTSSIEGAV